MINLVKLIYVLQSFGPLVVGHLSPTINVENGLYHERSLKAQSCSEDVGLMKRQRHRLRKREASSFYEGPGQAYSDTGSLYIIHGEAPHFDFIKNSSIVMTPEYTQGPYWYPPSQILTQDLTQGQRGVRLELDIGVIDVNTCAPAADVLVSLWHCNATGSYSSFSGQDPNTPFEELIKNNGVDLSKVGKTPDWTFLHTDQETWLRGMWPTDKHGATTFTSIFPGFYVERTIHIHAQVHTNWNVTKNGTVSHSRVVETAQIFFDEDLTTELMKLEPYSRHTEIQRLDNAGDGIFAQGIQSGAMTVADVQPLDGVDYRNGVLAYITLAIDTTTIKNGTSASPLGIETNSPST